MDLLDFYNSINLKRIKQFVEERQEEGLQLDFKTVNHPNRSGQESDNKNYSKALSGFANSAGGIIIWGIKCEKKPMGEFTIDAASELKPITELTSFINRLNELESQAVAYSVPGVLHKKVEDRKGSNVGFAVTYIPQSERTPHMAMYAGNYYYKRNGDSFTRCEHYEVIDLLSRRKSPRLRMEFRPYIQKIHSGIEPFVLISIVNESQTIAKLPYLVINTSSPWVEYEYGLDGSRNIGLKKGRSMVNHQFIFFGGQDICIYPQQRQDVQVFTAGRQFPGSIPSFNAHYQLIAEGMDTTSASIMIESDKFTHFGRPN